jgi:trk system potassium uptake protein TrkA
VRAIIVGAGKIGFELARRLAEKSVDVIVIDQDDGALQAIEENLDVMTMQGNGASAEILENALVKKTDLFIAVTDSDEVNIVACMIAKQAAVATTVARIRKPEYHGLYHWGMPAQHLGIDLVINPEETVAREIVEILKAPMANEIDFFANGKVRMVGYRVYEGAPIANKRLDQYHVTSGVVAAVLRKNEVLIPRGNTIILPGDELFIVSAAGSQMPLEGLSRDYMHPDKTVVVFGGSRIGAYIARIIEKTLSNGPLVKLICDDDEMCGKLASELQRTIVVKADGAYPEVLQEENVDRADVFIAVTGKEQTNLLVGFMAKDLGVPRVMVEIYRESYIPIATRMGIDIPIVPRITVASSILRLLHKTNVVSLSLIHQGAVEVMEIILPTESMACGKSLKELEFPEGSVVGAVIRGDSVVIPRGDTFLQEKDHVVVFALPRVVSVVEEYFK